jgi:hypothetical protein
MVLLGTARDPASCPPRLCIRIHIKAPWFASRRVCPELGSVSIGATPPQSLLCGIDVGQWHRIRVI